LKNVRFKQIRLIWRLFKDPRVPAWLKTLVILIPIVYILLPIDISPDATPILGQIDDIILALLALKVFLELSPRRVVEEQKRQIESISVPYRVLGKEEEKG